MIVAVRLTVSKIKISQNKVEGSGPNEIEWSIASKGLYSAKSTRIASS